MEERSVRFGIGRRLYPERPGLSGLLNVKRPRSWVGPGPGWLASVAWAPPLRRTLRAREASEEFLYGDATSVKP